VTTHTEEQLTRAMAGKELEPGAQGQSFSFLISPLPPPSAWSHK